MGHYKRLLGIYIIFFHTNSSKSGVHFTLTAHLKSDLKSGHISSTQKPNEANWYRMGQQHSQILQVKLNV